MQVDESKIGNVRQNCVEKERCERLLLLVWLSLLLLLLHERKECGTCVQKNVDIFKQNL